MTSQLNYQTWPRAVTVVCDECSKTWRYGCADCGELFATFHRNDTDHDVTVISRDELFRCIPTAERRRRQWFLDWEAESR